MTPPNGEHQLSRKLPRATVFIALSLTLAATAWLHLNDEAAVDLVAPLPKARPVLETSGTSELVTAPTQTGHQGTMLGIVLAPAKDRGRLWGQDRDLSANLFEAVAWLPRMQGQVIRSAQQTDTQAQPAQPVALAAPPLPFLLLGRYGDAKQLIVFLQHRDQNLVVREGDMLLDQYKVEKISESEMTLRFLPTNEVQTLQLTSLQSQG